VLLVVRNLPQAATIPVPGFATAPLDN